MAFRTLSLLLASAALLLAPVACKAKLPESALSDTAGTCVPAECAAAIVELEAKIQILAQGGTVAEDTDTASGTGTGTGTGANSGTDTGTGMQASRPQDGAAGGLANQDTEDLGAPTTETPLMELQSNRSGDSQLADLQAKLEAKRAELDRCQGTGEDGQCLADLGAGGGDTMVAQNESTEDQAAQALYLGPGSPTPTTGGSKPTTGGAVPGVGGTGGKPTTGGLPGIGGTGVKPTPSAAQCKVGFQNFKGAAPISHRPGTVTIMEGSKPWGGAYLSIAFDPGKPKTAAALSGAKVVSDQMRKAGKSDSEIAAALVAYTNQKVFPQDTWYDLKQQKSEPTFDKAMTGANPGASKSHVGMDDLIGIGHADCRGRNMFLAAAMNQAGVKAQMTNTKASTDGADENHTVVTYTGPGGKQMVADAYFRHFNGDLDGLQKGKEATGGRWNQADAPKVQAKIVQLQGFPTVSAVTVKPNGGISIPGVDNSGGTSGGKIPGVN